MRWKSRESALAHALPPSFPLSSQSEPEPIVYDVKPSRKFVGDLLHSLSRMTAVPLPAEARARVWSSLGGILRHMLTSAQSEKRKAAQKLSSYYKFPVWLLRE